MTDTRSQLDWLARDGLPQLALLVTTRAPGTTQGGARAEGSKPPLHLHPIAVEQDVHALLVGWVRIAIEDGLAEDWPTNDTVSICQWLTGAATALLQHDAADDFAAEVERCWRDVRQALGEVFEFPCEKCGVPAYIDQSGRHAQCVLGHEMQVDNFGRRQMQRPPIATDKAVIQFGVTRDQLYQWNRRGLITPAGREGRTLTWRPWDVFRLVNPQLAEEIEWADARDREIEDARKAG